MARLITKDLILGTLYQVFLVKLTIKKYTIHTGNIDFLRKTARMSKTKVIKKSALSPTVLLAGGAGFIGSHLAESLLAKNARVIVLDNFSTGKKIHVNHLLTNPNFALYDVDINQGLPSEIESVDYIVHLAGLEEYLYSKEYTNLDALLTNALGTKNLLDLSKKSPAKFMLLSSIDVYQGLMSQLDLKDYFGRSKMDENKYLLTEAKRYAEALVWEYYKKFSLDVRIVRLPEIFGPKMDLDSSGSLGRYLKELIEGRNLEVFGDGVEKEFYLYIGDAVSGILKALFKDESKGNIYSLFKGEALSSLEVAYLVKSVADRDVSVVFKPHPFESDFRPKFKIPDTHNLGELGWAPGMSVKDGITKTLEWFGYSANAHSFKPAKLISDKKGADYLAGQEKVSVAPPSESLPIPKVDPVPKPEVTSKPEILPASDPVVEPKIGAEPKLTQKAVEKAEKPVPEPVSYPPFAQSSQSQVPVVLPSSQPSPEAPQSLFSLQGVKQEPPEEQNTFETQQDIIKTSSEPKRQVFRPEQASQKRGFMATPNFIGRIKQKVGYFMGTLGVVVKTFPAKINPFGFLIPLLQNTVIGELLNRIKESPLLSRFSFLRNNSGILLGVFTALVAASIIFVTVPAIQTYYGLKNGVASLENVGEAAGQLNSSRVRENARVAYDNLYNAKKSFRQLGWFFKMIGKRREYVSIDKLISSLAYSAKAGHDASRSVEPFESLWEVIRPDTPSQLDVEVFDQAKLEIGAAKNSLQRAIADFKYVDISVFPESVQPKLIEYQSYLTTADKSLDLAIPLLGAIPDVLGSTSSKKYLILFQNSNEIRPTGGFIGSYGILDFENGKIKNLTIDDVYNPDGQIDLRNIDVEPPAPIKEFLGEEKLHIRNANWNPDFGKSANTIEDLYFRVTGDKVDGVIGIDLNFVESLLKVTGPIFLTAYNEEITAENLYERAEFHSEFNYENGSDQKRSFLTILGGKLLEKIFALPREKLPFMLTEIGAALEQKSLLIYFSNSPINVLLDEKNWNGKLVEMENDYVYVVNANVGGTKANYYIKNHYNYTVTSQTRDGVLRGILRMEYKHEGKDNAWPGGPYTNYVRVLTQEGSKLTGAQIKKSGTEEPVDILEKVLVSSEGKYTVFGTDIKVNPGETAFLTFTYDLPAGLSLSKEVKNYNLYWQKQPGTSGDTFNVMFDVPFGMEIDNMSTVFTKELDFVQAKGELDKDKQFYVKLL